MTSDEYKIFKKWWDKNVIKSHLYIKRWRNDGNVWIGNSTGQDIRYFYTIIRKLQDLGYTCKYINPYVVSVHK